MKVAGRYWEKTVESNESGESALRLRCVTKVTVKKSDLLRQLRAATDNKSQGNAKIRNSLLNAQQGFIDGLSTGH